MNWKPHISLFIVYKLKFTGLNLKYSKDFNIAEMLHAWSSSMKSRFIWSAVPWKDLNLGHSLYASHIFIAGLGFKQEIIWRDKPTTHAGFPVSLLLLSLDASVECSFITPNYTFLLIQIRKQIWVSLWLISWNQHRDLFKTHSPVTQVKKRKQDSDRKYLKFI